LAVALDSSFENFIVVRIAAELKPTRSLHERDACGDQTDEYFGVQTRILEAPEQSRPDKHVGDFAEL
jgi:hypothetical protein